MNYILLYIIIFILIVLIALILILNKTVVNVIGDQGGVIITPGGCTVNTSTLPNLSFNQCCNLFGIATGNRYLSSLNLVVSPTQIDYLSVCAGFCLGGYNKTTGTCENLGPNVDSGVTNFNLCVASTKPVGCSDLSLPVAISGTQLLYASSATNLLCQTTSPCAITG